MDSPPYTTFYPTPLGLNGYTSTFIDTAIQNVPSSGVLLWQWRKSDDVLWTHTHCVGTFKSEQQYSMVDWLRHVETDDNDRVGTWFHRCLSGETCQYRMVDAGGTERRVESTLWRIEQSCDGEPNTMAGIA